MPDSDASTAFAVVAVSSAKLGAAEFHRQHVVRSRPVLLTDGAASWPAVQRWSPQYLRQVLKDRPVALKRHPSGIFDYNQNAWTGAVSVVHTTFDKATDLILAEGSPVHYLQQENLNRFPELVQEVPRPYLLADSAYRSTTNIWFGAKATRSPLHFDRSENLFAQIFGRKIITLFSPEESRYLYPAAGDRMPHCSRVDVFKPDLRAFPLYGRAARARMTVEVAAGAMLFIPSGWWHAVESLDVAASVNTWWNENARETPTTASPA